MRRPAFCFVRDDRAGTAAEFALVLPLLLIFLLGMIDVGRLMWTWNRAEKATQMGVRYAVATDIVPTGLYTHNFSVSDGVAQGDTVNTGLFSSMTCTSTTCNNPACVGTACVSLITPFNSTAFNKIVDRMKLFLPEIEYQDVEIKYTNVGLGYAGDPNGSDVSPLVTVSLKPNSVPFTPLFLFNAVTFHLPSFSAALTLEDGTCDGRPCYAN